jgi:ATP-dependent helicase HrpA
MTSGKALPGRDPRRHAAAVASAERMRRIEALDLTIPSELPIAAHAEAITSLLRERTTIVVSGETGSGKSTQLPKICLAAGLGRTGFVGHTQPRRIAARSIAQRLAEELQSQLGDHVGFKIRFADQTKPETLVKLMTDGVLLAETQSDRSLRAYDAIIIDEAHERSLNIDFLLGYLRRLREQRPLLRTIITSATIDAERFAEHFADASGPAPIVVVEGRSYPVDIRHRPWEDCAGVDEEGMPRPYDLDRHVIHGVDEIMSLGGGDILVFLPTEHDIREVSKSVAGHFKRQGRAGQVELLPLYARLPQSEQTKIFNPSGQMRRIVFATNVAESSLTVPGIRYVIDSGTARISRYSPRSKVQRLPIEAISQASARQRAGRCGRVAPGVCIRLYGESDFLSREAYTTPEIRRTNLAAVILQTKVLKLGAVDEFPFIDPPRPDAIREGYRTLIEIGALDERRQLTAVGRQLGRMPVDPRVGRMILAAEQNGVLAEVLVIAAALEIQDPRERPPDKKQAADEAQGMFQDPTSDFVSYLRLWHFYEQCREKLSKGQLEKALRSRFLSPNRMREWADVYRQLRELIRTLDRAQKVSGKEASKEPAPRAHAIPSPRLQMDGEKLASTVLAEDRYALVHQSLLAGLLSGSAMLGDKNEYTGSGGLKLFLWPGSGVFASRPKWIVAAELVETSRTFARCVGRVQPEWLENVGAHLVKRNYSDPHWSEHQNGAFCYERVSLFGLPIVARRRIPLAPIDPPTARSLMIEQGLVEGLMQTRARAALHNRNLQLALADLAAKTRRRDLVIDPYTIQRFYEQRIPEHVVDRARLEQWDRTQAIPGWANMLGNMDQLIQWLDHPPPKHEGDESTLFMRPEVLMPEPELGVRPAEFPDELLVGETRLPLVYRFEPGADDDGITITVPQAALPQVSDQRLGWLVPGLLEEKIQAMIKSLPKRIRRNLVPAADTARLVSGELAESAGTIPFLPALCKVLSDRAEMKIEEADFDQEKLSEHLKFHIQIVDDGGKRIAQGRSVSEVRKKLNLGDDVPHALMGEQPELRDKDLDRDGLTAFDLDILPVEVVRLRGGVAVAHYPTLVDRGTCVDVRVMADRLSAEQVLARGLMRLFAIAERKELRSQVRWLPEIDKARMLMAHTLPAGTFEENLVDLLARRSFVDGEPLVRTSDVFAARRSERGKRIAIATQTIALWLPQLATAIHAVRQWLETNKQPHLRPAIEDVRLQAERLLTNDFLQETPWEWLQHFPRYFKAMEYRLEKLRSGSLSRDAEWMSTVSRLWQNYQAIVSNPEDPRAGKSLEARWLMEELRVSLFAQPLGTATKVSPQRIEKLLSS